MAPVRGRHSTSAHASNNGPVPLPDYKSPSFPLNAKAQEALRNLPRNHKLDPLKTRLEKANNLLTQAAVDINDLLQEKAAGIERKKARMASASQGTTWDSTDDDRELDEMRCVTDETTNDLESSVRRIVDAGEGVKWLEDALKDLNSNIETRQRSQPQTQSTLGASQFRPNRAENSDEEEEEDQGEGSQAQPNQQPISALEMLKQDTAQRDDSYKLLSMGERYATHNNYVQFRKLVHDAHYPGEEAPPLPHSSTWFADEVGATQASSSQGRVPGSQQVEDDDDIAIATERVSVKCPITLTEMKDPVSSTKCPHNYEKSAVLQMIDLSEMRAGGDGRRNRGQKAMRCPVPGCDVLITADDLQTNPVLVRKIKRLQAALNSNNEDDDEEMEGESRRRSRSLFGAQEAITSSPAGPQALRVKAERISQITARQASMIPNTQFSMDPGNDSEVGNRSGLSVSIDIEEDGNEETGEESMVL